MSEANILGPLGAGREENLGRGGVGIFFQKVVLDFPDIFDAKLIGEFDLIQRLVINPHFRVFFPRRRHLMLVE